MTELDPQLYTIAWIAPLGIEARAATYMLDNRHHGRFPLQRGDDYVFQAGDVCGHNVIIATLPAGQEYGTGSAAALASQVKKFFPNLWFGLLVGVAAGLPNLTGPCPRDIRLGDVLVALPEGESAGLIAYDLGKETAKDGFQPLRGGHVLAMTETVVRSAIGSIRLHALDDVQLFRPFYEKMKDKRHEGGTFTDPGQEADRLYETDDSGATKLKDRERRPDDMRTRVWYGTIGSGEKLMKNASRRDALRDKYNLIGIEMEAAGAMNRIPVGVFRGVCDYGDEHKNKDWQPYAAAMAAAYAKAVLAQIGPREGDGQETTGLAMRKVCHIPFRQNKNFTGREPQIEKLRRMLFAEEKERVAVVGLGGMGKTQIALELAHRVKHKMKQYSILWMPAQTMPAFQKTATELVQKLAIPCGSGDDPKEALQSYLSSEATGHWLLILDNADDMTILDGLPGKSTSLFDFLPQSPTGRILITTRSSKIAVNAAGSDVLELAEMMSDEAAAFLGKSLIDKNQLKQVDIVAELLEKLTYLPLTVAQAAAYMNMNRMPIIEYSRLCNRTNQDMINLLSTHLRDETHYSKTQGAVATTWIISFNTICEIDTVAARLLSFIRWIEPKAIPRSILPGPDSDWNLTQALGLVCGYGFLAWREDGETVDMHSLVHLALKIWPGQSSDNFMTQGEAIEHLARVFPSNDWENRSLWRQYFPHVLPLMRSSALKQYTRALDLGYDIGCCLRTDGRIAEGVEVLRSVVTIREKTLAENHPNRLASQHALAMAYQANGQVKQAIELLENVVAIDKKLAKDHPS
ncbi:Putative Pfs, NACHT and WD domain protein [Tolypocladium paradoxum]|uniref:Pfs, NACHT and WD domain protein n=1 Tax=Tolypocladium paradoxum TaxID=94208 RepID=A0A2S4KWI7_9HYPO|nr:Putative Pfs, NACHT and WD domain protein [Tolypocladium paradoxum]